MTPEPRRTWTAAEERILARAMQRPRGRYAATRASQLAGVPERTLYDWAKSGVVVPDYATSRPKKWSYRDLVFVRMTAWLRANGMSRPEVIDRVAILRKELERVTLDDRAMVLRTDGLSVLQGNETMDRHTGQAVLGPSLASLFAEFELVVPAEVEELGSRKLWGPDLVTPAPKVVIDPWVMGGEPCIVDTRIPTSTLYALERERGLSPAAVATLYRGAVSEDDVVAARILEQALASRKRPAALAA